ncbi:MAG: prephenate dehydrogenase/arogenate dehydrogenase family protein [Candidatus Eremiobacteraeota bacterium]|nr:prephenate dehydrogenase/arogenate dehydrogenase family protein [Candidatus Eremiobacteraeota bacterium]
MKQRVVGIVGTGLIGGSIGKRARRNGALVLGYDRDVDAPRAALEAGSIDEAVARDDLYRRADTVVIAAYLDGVLAEIERIRNAGPVRASLVIDVASVKAPVVHAAEGVPNFVATHPMAGTERSGARFADAELFENRTWAYVPSGDEALDARARAFVESFGAIPLAVDAAEHDRIVGFTSHLPQILAWAYGRRAAAYSGDAFDPLVGRTAKELLRLSRSDFGFWRSVLAANVANVEPELRALATALTEAADALATCTAESETQVQAAARRE